MSKPEDGEKKVDQVDQVHQVDHEETLLAALLEEELALSQMLEEAMALSMSAVTTPPTHNQEDQENLQKAIALSFTELPKNKEQEVDSKKRDEDFETELALSVADPPKILLGHPLQAQRLQMSCPGYARRRTSTTCSVLSIWGSARSMPSGGSSGPMTVMGRLT